MISKEELEKFILENCVDRDGYIDLRGLKFPDHVVLLSRLEAERIFNNEQKSEYIYNANQKAKAINNDNQEAKEIYNYNQEAGVIYNYRQKIIEAKTPLQKKIEELEAKSDELQQKINELKQIKE